MAAGLAASTAASTAALGVVSPTGAAPPAAVPTADAGPALDFTLLTGDVVRLRSLPDGTPHGEVIHDAGRPDDVVFQQVDDDLYALTGEAVRLIGTGWLDRELFNLTALAEYGYDDAGVDALPVIATAPAGSRSGPATSALAVDGAAVVQPLDSIGATALTIDKDRVEEVWADLTGNLEAATGTATRTGDTAAPVTLWLDAKVRTALDVSVPAIGAPTAWESGYDGTGTTIAVLDTGIDADHPDFAGRITASRSFVTGEPTNDLNGHGTHVASIAAGAGDTYIGVAPGADLAIGKVCAADGTCPTSAIIAGMEWAAVEQDADVVNLSLNGAPTDGADPMSRAVNELTAATGALFVVAAGNSGRTGGTMQVGTPATADSALAVGNTAKTAPHELSDSSSVGPRLSDYAVKPEITAPGEAIVAARATDGVIGAPVDDHYTSLSGTSMATPHVVGAAALVAEQHPDWTAGQLKDALVSTANPHAEAPVTAQGAGMLDVTRATAGPLVATGTLNLGAIEPPHTATTGIVTLRNTSGAPLPVDLALAGLIRTDPTSRDVTPLTPPDGAVTVTPSSVQIPAGGTAAVEVTVDTTAFELASYFGRLEARAGGDLLASTTLSWTRSPQRHQLTVSGIDRTGAPAHTTCCSWLTLINLDTATAHLGWYDEGRAYFAGFGYNTLLPEGRYAVLSNISDWTAGEPWALVSETLGGDPELLLDRDTDLLIDARDGIPVTIEGPRSDAEPVQPGMDATWRRVLGEPGYEDLRVQETFSRVPTVYVIPTGEATIGEFSLTVGTRLAAEDLTMTVPGSGSPALDPQYLRSGTSDVSGCNVAGHIMCVPAFDSPGSYQLVDAGSGSPAQLAAAAGRLALVHEATPRDSVAMGEFLAAAADAGVAGILYAVADPGPPQRWIRDRVEVPAAVITAAEGDQLAAAIAGGATTIRTGGEIVSPYVYDLCVTDTGRLPSEPAYTFDHDDLATITAEYAADAPGTVYRESRVGLGATGCPLGHSARSTAFEAPHTRTEYITPGHWWRTTTFSAEHYYGVEADRRTVYEAGEHVTEQHLAAPLAPRIDALSAHRLSGTSYLSMSGFPFVTSPWFTLQQSFGAVDVRYRRDGEPLCESQFNSGCYVDPVPGRYQLEVETQQSRRPISTATRTVWDVAAAFDRPDEPLPAIALDYDVPLDGTNAVRAGTPYRLTVTAGYQPEHTEIGDFTVQAWVSHDDGATWTELGTRPAGRDGDATFLVRPPREGAEFTTVRVLATDGDGNSVDQTITRAWRVAQP
ncbi:S8 family peptidase [Jiangella asiatica]|uniref:Peptidase S8/S53 domain-containing protein n=1 Tax=Jiangella asiatica TaxID=2530372 RepID=A0A4R5CNZ7_9ACTN|nr:S8 family serine peptidase [Jiangella asiatica]TDE01806.1 hypothetical protein E1269_22620 [Jiangella asiatica]